MRLDKISEVQDGEGGGVALGEPEEVPPVRVGSGEDHFCMSRAAGGFEEWEIGRDRSWRTKRSTLAGADGQLAGGLAFRRRSAGLLPPAGLGVSEEGGDATGGKAFCFCFAAEIMCPPRAVMMRGLSIARIYRTLTKLLKITVSGFMRKSFWKKGGLLTPV